MAEITAYLHRPIVVLGLVMPFDWYDLVVRFLPALATIVLGIWIVYRLLRKIVNLAPWSDRTRAILRAYLRGGAQAATAVAVIGLVGGLLGVEIAEWTAFAFRALNQPFFISGGTQISIITLVMVIPVFVAASWASRVARDTIEHGFLKRVALDPARQFSLLSAVRVLVMVIISVIGLSIIGINLSSLAVVFGVLGIGVGFGLQDVIANMFAGLVIIFSHPIKEGDRISVGQMEGTVQSIKLIHTVITTPTNETIIVPNSHITNTNVHNYSYDSPNVVMCTSVQVSYQADVDRVMEILVGIARRNPYGLEGEDPRVHLWSFESSGIQLRVCTWIRNAQERIIAMTWTNLEIWRVFREQGVQIPFPQVDVHIKDVPTPVPQGLAAADLRQ